MNKCLCIECINILCGFGDCRQDCKGCPSLEPNWTHSPCDNAIFDNKEDALGG
jgi:hypothetical protein